MLKHRVTDCNCKNLWNFFFLNFCERKTEEAFQIEMEIVLTELPLLLNQWSNTNWNKSDTDTSDIIFARKIEHRNKSQIERLFIEIDSNKWHFSTNHRKDDRTAFDKSFTDFFMDFIGATVHCWCRRSWCIS